MYIALLCRTHSLIPTPSTLWQAADSWDGSRRRQTAVRQGAARTPRRLSSGMRQRCLSIMVGTGTGMYMLPGNSSTPTVTQFNPYAWLVRISPGTPRGWWCTCCPGSR